MPAGQSPPPNSINKLKKDENPFEALQNISVVGIFFRIFLHKVVRRSELRLKAFFGRDFLQNFLMSTTSFKSPAAAAVPRFTKTTFFGNICTSKKIFALTTSIPPIERGARHIGNT